MSEQIKAHAHPWMTPREIHLRVDETEWQHEPLSNDTMYECTAQICARLDELIRVLGDQD